VPDFALPVPLSGEHELDAFDCGSDAQSEWLRRNAHYAQAADVIRVRATLIHAEPDKAKQFYLDLAGFESSPTDPLHLVPLMKNLRAALSAI
jgi:hypothetical protein